MVVPCFCAPHLPKPSLCHTQPPPRQQSPLPQRHNREVYTYMAGDNSCCKRYGNSYPPLPYIFRSVIIMRSALRNHNLLCFNFVHNSIHIIDSSAPPATPVLTKRLRLSNPFKWISLNVFNNYIDPAKRFLVLSLPIDIIFPTIWKEE